MDFMISGHLAVGLALKKVDRGFGLGVIFIAALAPDIVLGLLLLSGLESVEIPGNFSELGYVVFSAPYSHSLASGLIAAAVFYALGWVLFKSHARAAILGAAAASHYLLDLISYVPGLPVLWGSSETVGIGLWRDSGTALGVEVLLLVAGLGVFLVGPATRRDIKNKYTLALVVVLLSGLAMGGQWFAPATPPEIDVAVLLIVWPGLAIAAGFLLDSTERRGASSGERQSFGPWIKGIITGKGDRQPSLIPEHEEAESEEEDEEEEEEEEEEEKDQRIWPPERVDLTDRLWGDGITTPGGAEYVIEFVQLLALSDAKSLLNLGAGFGGAARIMADRHGVWVSAFEASEDMAAIGKERSNMAGMGKKAPVSRYDPEAPRFKKNGFNAVVALESFYTVENKERLIKAMDESLRTDGTLLFTDFVLNKDGSPNDAVKRWRENEQIKTNLVTANHLVALIEKRPLLNLHIANDITHDYRSRVINGWLAFVETLTRDELSPFFFDLVIRECEYWACRIDALDSGQLRVYRFEAVKRPPPRADIASLPH